MPSQSILVVSPNGDDSQLSSELLASSGMSFVEATDLSSVNSSLESRSDIGLIVIFHNPPQLAGDHLVEKIRGKKATVPIIFICDLMDNQILINILRFDHLTLMKRDHISEKLLFAVVNHLKSNRRYDGSERRKFRRIGTKLKADMGALGPGVVLNLSTGGSFVGTGQNIEIGTDIVLDLPLLGQDSILVGKVVWSVPPSESNNGIGGVGIQFTDPTPEQSKSLARFIFLQVKNDVLK